MRRSYRAPLWLYTVYEKKKKDLLVNKTCRRLTLLKVITWNLFHVSYSDIYSRLDSSFFNQIICDIYNLDLIEKLLSNSEFKSRYLTWDEFQVKIIKR